MPQFKGEGVVLRSSNLGEWDKLLVVLGQGAGKTRIVAKGARKVQSRYASLTQVFSHINYTVYSGRSLATFSQAELRQGFPALRDNLDKMAYGLYLLELVDSLLEEGQVHDDILSLLLASLHILSLSDKHELLLGFFQIRLLARLGWATSPADLSLSTGASRLFGILWEKDWRYIGELEFEFEVMPDAVEITQKLARVLSGHMGKEAKSYNFLLDIQRNRG